MGKATIQYEFGNGLYVVTMRYAGRAENQARIATLNARIAELQTQYDGMPETTPQEIWDKQIVGLQIEALEKQVAYLTDNFPSDPLLVVYCADATLGLIGDVGLIEVPGEYESADKLNIVPGYSGDAAWDQERDGQLTPSLGLGPWGTFLNRAMLPGWQKFSPLYRYGTIIADSIDFENDTCDVCLNPEHSSQLNLAVNQGAGFSECQEADDWPAFTTFCAENPTHPTCTNTEPGTPTFISDAQLAEIRQINSAVNSEHEYETDQSGYRRSDYMAIMGPGETGDCEDFAITKMQELIDSGYPVRNLQLAGVAVEGTTVTNHAILIIQTVNRGTLVLDNRYDEVREISTLPYRFTEYQRAGQDWQTVSTRLEAVPIEYMSCNARAFADGDEVIVKFTDQDFSQPKVIGFRASPTACDLRFWLKYRGTASWFPCWIYDPIPEVYRTFFDDGYPANGPGPGRWLCSTFNDPAMSSVYIAGGYFETPVALLDDLTQYNFSLDAWYVKTSMSEPLGRGGGFNVGRAGYAVTGAQGSLWEYGDPAGPKSFEYDMDADTWQQVDNLDYPSTFGIDWSIGDYGYWGGGLQSSPAALRDELQKYDKVVNAWSTHDYLPDNWCFMYCWQQAGKGYWSGGIRYTQTEGKDVVNIGGETAYFCDYTYEHDPLLLVNTKKNARIPVDIADYPYSDALDHSPIRGAAAGDDDQAFCVGGAQSFANFLENYKYVPTTDTYTEQPKVPSVEHPITETDVPLTGESGEASMMN